MKGIIGRKLGMTQVFDEETGSLTPVTVIQAGPCPVVAVRTADADGYDAVQLAFDEVAEGKLSKPKLGHLKKHDVGPHRKLVEILRHLLHRRVRDRRRAAHHHRARQRLPARLALLPVGIDAGAQPGGGNGGGVVGPTKRSDRVASLDEATPPTSAPAYCTYRLRSWDPSSWSECHAPQRVVPQAGFFTRWRLQGRSEDSLAATCRSGMWGTP